MASSQYLFSRREDDWQATNLLGEGGFTLHETELTQFTQICTQIVNYRQHRLIMRIARHEAQIVHYRFSSDSIQGSSLPPTSGARRHRHRGALHYRLQPKRRVRPPIWSICILGYRLARRKKNTFLDDKNKYGQRKVGGVLSLVAPELLRAVSSSSADAFLVPGHQSAFCLTSMLAEKLNGKALLVRGEAHFQLEQKRRYSKIRSALLGLYYKRFDGLLTIGTENRQGIKIGCPEEASLWSGFLSVRNFEALISNSPKSGKCPVTLSRCSHVSQSLERSRNPYENWLQGRE